MELMTYVVTILLLFSFCSRN